MVSATWLPCRKIATAALSGCPPASQKCDIRSSRVKHPGFLFECLSAFVISKTLSGQKPRGRQLNKKVCGSKFAIFVFLSFFIQTTLSNNDNSKNDSSTRLHFSTKLMLIPARSFPTTQRLHSLKFTLVNKSHSQLSVVGCC